MNKLFASVLSLGDSVLEACGGCYHLPEDIGTRYQVSTVLFNFLKSKEIHSFKHKIMLRKQKSKILTSLVPHKAKLKTPRIFLDSTILDIILDGYNFHCRKIPDCENGSK